MTMKFYARLHPLWHLQGIIINKKVKSSKKKIARNVKKVFPRHDIRLYAVFLSKTEILKIEGHSHHLRFIHIWEQN